MPRHRHISKREGELQAASFAAARQDEKREWYDTTMTDETPMPFGKHKGKPMQRVPADYLLWLWEGTNSPMLHKEKGGLANYIRTNFSAIEQEAPNVIIVNRPDRAPRP